MEIWRWIRLACALGFGPFTNFAALAQVVLLSLPIHSPSVGDDLGRFHTSQLHWTLEGGVYQSGLGNVLPGRMDFDGDRREELIFAGERHPLHAKPTGKVWALHWFPPQRPKVVWSWAPTNTSVLAGAALAAGDFDGNGFPELALSLPRGSRRGVVQIHSGGAAGLSVEPTDYRMPTTASASLYGQHLLARDVNKDGFMDLFIGNPRWSNDAGRVELYLGSASGLAQRFAWAVAGSEQEGLLGHTFVCLDANGDGRLDLAVTSLKFRQWAGRVQLFLGTNTDALLAASPAWTEDGPHREFGFGTALAALGDLDRDGRDELGVGIPSHKRGSGWPGRACVYYGAPNGLEAAARWSYSGHSADSGLGYSLGAVGDVNGDGWSDLLIGQPGMGPLFTQRGGAYVFLGGPNGLPELPSWSVMSMRAGDATGHGVTPLGDINHDGLADFAVSSPHFTSLEEDRPLTGRIDIFFGHKSAYAPGGFFPADGTNSTTRKDTPMSLRAESSQMKLLVQETKAKSAADSRAARWLRRLAWTSPLWLSLGFIMWRWRRRKAVASAALRERERFARDLHDGVGSGVHRLQRLTELLNQVASNSPEAMRYRNELLQVAQELGGTVDRTIWAVKPENDTLENLVNYLASYAPSVLRSHGIECELELPGTLPPQALCEDTRQHLFLAVNEALNNVVKHSRAHRVLLRIEWESPWLAITVQDDGCGFSTAASRASGGDGLKNLRERMSCVTGSVEIRSEPGQGTKVNFKIPLHQR